MMKNFSNYVMAVAVAMSLFLLVVVSPPVEAVTCSPLQLSPCLAAFTSDTPPSSTCCQRLKEQRPCLCGYLKNPSLRQYVNSPASRKIASSCGVPFPTC
ncbi:hypothetical protein HN51_071240 [Arachis hypogaea]|uniref:Bifunctional inhibitor/plant lipid transfer protein/seed storage helical domain-containing protein n=1 Tax=Arachis hypogaea TaxID=3818 RepID=A0A444YYV9_ARAHY|nr:non-specific lipid-transfer protein 2 [Arachis ipaensis]QHO13816.1 Non-specific lipid-transfer protein [Arachis hypogaea]RYR07123.1 hypothetical protein Ahy_B05g074443 [Arachis hypogaea]